MNKEKPVDPIEMMSFSPSIATCIRKFADFKGLAVRSEFWWFQLFLMLAGMIVQIIEEILVQPGLNPQYACNVGVIYGLWFLISLLPDIAVSVRRLRDTSNSVWFVLLLIPANTLLLVGCGTENKLALLGILFYIPLIIMWCEKSRDTNPTAVESV